MLVISKHSRAQGFTLIESMVVVALIAILAAIATPSMREFIATMNAKSAAFDLISDLTLARAEAVKRNAPVEVTAVDGDWAKGWKVRIDGADFRTRAAVASGLTVTSGSTSLSFRANGRLGANDTVNSNTTWSIASTSMTISPRCVVITPTGAARSKTGAC